MALHGSEEEEPVIQQRWIIWWRNKGEKSTRLHVRRPVSAGGEDEPWQVGCEGILPRALAGCKDWRITCIQISSNASELVTPPKSF